MNTANKAQNAASSATSKATPNAAAQAASKISQIAGGNFILPGEDAQQFYHSYALAIDELGAKTPLQHYYVQQIFQSLWWIRRYELQKRASLIAESVKTLQSLGLAQPQALKATKLLEAGLWDDPALISELQNKGFTPESLLQRAHARQHEYLMSLDQCIELKAHTLVKLQKSYEALVNRSVMQERLKLQNDLLKRDLLAIDVPVVKDLQSSAQQLPNASEQWEPEYDER